VALCVLGAEGGGGAGLIVGGGHVIAEERVQPGQQAASEQPDEPCAARGQHPQDGLRVGHRSAGTDLTR
jgi:hypothetical protein